MAGVPTGWWWSPATLRFYDVPGTVRNDPAIIVAARGPRTASGLLPHRQLGDDHLAVRGLAHVVDRQRGHGAGVQGLHLDAGAVDRVDLCLDRDVVVTDLEVDVDRADQERMAQGDHVGRAL